MIYTSKPGEEDLPTGDSLGELTDELDCYGPGSFITEFTSAGPKNYSFKVWGTKDKRIHTVVKVKGVPLNFTSVKHVNFNIMKRKVQAFVRTGAQEETSVVSWRIRRLPDHRVVTRAERKKYRVVYDKRVVKRDYTTVPYGY